MAKARRKKQPPRPIQPPEPPPEPEAAPDTQPSFPNRFIRRYGWLPPLLLALGVNAIVLTNGMVWDDQFIVGGQPHAVRETTSAAVAPGAYYRPLIEWSYQLDRWIWGAGPFGFHLTVYLAHVLTVLLYYFCLRLLLRLYQKEEAIALLAASLFAVHPIHIEAVAWIAGRNDVLMALFILTALYAYLRNAFGTSWVITLPLFLSGCALSLLCKETALPFLLFFPGLDIFFHRAGIRRRKGILSPMTWALVPMLAGFAVYRSLQVGWPPVDATWASAPAFGLQSLLAALGYYFNLLLTAYPLNLFVSEPPAGSFYIVAGASGLLVLLWIIVQWNRTLFAIGAVWFLLGIAAPLALFFVRVSATPVAERYAYLASGGFLFLVSLGAWEFGQWIRARAGPGIDLRWGAGGAALIIGLFSCMTVDRNAVWKDDIALWEDTVQKSPAAAVAYNNLGQAYNDGGRTDQVTEAYRTALKLKPDYAMTYNNMGSLLADQGRIEESFRAYEMALILDPDYPTAHYNLGRLFDDQGHPDQAALEYQTALHLVPGFAEAHNNLGSVHAEQGNLDKAVREFRIALQLKPGLVVAHYNLGNAYLRQDRMAEAAEAFQSALQIKPDFGPARQALERLNSKP